ncbi:SRPBCC domain-containing protein [Streptomyces sp. NPDC057496]|uniref:SRPBCC family protein n=1 Tax=Streptomyces sp. NPDC057496 TaxID=3346149 RepID=UPI0036969899
MPTGLTKDAGWEIGVSRTLPLPPAAVWDFLTGREGARLWLGPVEGAGGLPTEKGEPYRTADGVAGELRGHRPGSRIRLTHGSTTVQVTVSPAPGAGGTKSVLRFHQEHLASAAEREERRAHWRRVMDEIAGALC